MTPDDGGPVAGAERETPLTGREDELERLAAVAAESRSDADPARLVALIGAPGVGKRTVLQTFRSRHGRTAPVAPVLDLRKPPPIDEALERMASGLDGDAFQRFHSALGALRKREAGRKPVAVQAGDAMRRGGATATELFPGTISGVARLAGESLALGAEAREAARDLDLLKHFQDGVAALGRTASWPVVLLIANLDHWPEDPTVIWVQQKLLPNLVRLPVLIVVSTGSEDTVQRLEALTAVEVRPIARFTESESRQFVTEVLELDPDCRLAREITEDANGFPERLAAYQTYFERKGRPAADEPLPEAARAWVGGGLAFEPLQTIPDRFARRLLLYASPLRVLNAELLRRVAAAAGLAEADRDAGELLEADRRPPWIVRVDAGWAFDEDARRAAFVDECRRLDPGVYAAVHRAAVEYHRERLAQFEASPPSGDAASAAFEPVAPPARRLANTDYISAVAEWLYHVLAVDPEAGFTALADQVAEALFYEEPTVAIRFLAFGLELRLPKEQLLAARRLSKLARACLDGRPELILRLVEDVLPPAPGTEALWAVAEHMGGKFRFWLDRPEHEVVASFTAAEEGLRERPSLLARRIRVDNLLWLAYNTALLEGREAGDRVLATAEALARELPDSALDAELWRVRGMIAEADSDRDTARTCYDEAIARYRPPAPLSDYAWLLHSRGRLSLSIGELRLAREDLTRAATILSQLEHEGESDVSQALLELELREGNADAANAARQAILQRERNPFQAWNAIGNVYYGAAFVSDGRAPDLLRDAVKAYGKALAEDLDPIVLSNRARALQELADRTSDDPDEARTLASAALDDLRRANAEDPEGIGFALDLAERLRQRGEGGEAEEIVNRLLTRLLERLGKHGQRPVLTRDVRRTLMSSLEYLSPENRVSVLTACTAQWPDDADLHYVLGLALTDAGYSSQPPWASPHHTAEHAFQRACELAGEVLDPSEAASEREIRDDSDKSAGEAGPPEVRDETDDSESADEVADAAPDELAPDEAYRRVRYLVALADALSRTGHREEWARAERCAERALELVPDDEAAEQVLARVQRQRRRDAWVDESLSLSFVGPLRVEVGDDLLRWVDPELSPDDDLFERQLPAMRGRIKASVGAKPPGVRVRHGAGLGRREFRVLVHGVARARVTLETDYLAGVSASAFAKVAGSPTEVVPTVRPWDRGEGAFIAPGDLVAALASDIPTWDPRGAITAVVDVVVTDHIDSLIGPLAAEVTALELNWNLDADQLVRAATLLRDLAAMRIQPERIPSEEIAALLAADRQSLRARLQAIAMTEAPPAPEEGFELYALGREVRRTRFAAIAEPWRRDDDGSQPAMSEDVGGATLVIRISADVDAGGRLTEMAGAAADCLCAALELPRPRILVESSADLGTDEFELEVDGVPRFAGTRPTAWSEWHRHRPVAGYGGRSSVVVADADGGGRPGLGAAVARAVEQVLWDDPGLLLPPAVAERLCRTAQLADTSEGVADIAEVLRDLASRRVGLGPISDLRAAVDATVDVAASELADDTASPAPLRKVTVASSAAERLIPDEFEPGVCDQIHVDVDGIARDMTVRANFRHSCPSDLRFRLTAPNAATAELPNESRVGSGRTLVVPVHALEHGERFLGRSPAGTWTLHVADSVARDIGSLLGWSLEFAVETSPDRPPPAAATAAEDAVPTRVDDATRRVCRVQHIARRLRTYTIVVSLSDDLADALRPDSSESRVQACLSSALRDFKRESGLNPLGAVRWERVDDLPPGAYRIAVNELPRASGRLQEGRVFRLGEADDHAWVAPWNGAPGTWVDGPPAPGDIDPADFVVRHLAACLFEALAEFADLSWTEQIMSQTDTWPQSIGALVRRTYRIETIAAVVEQMAGEQAALRDSRIVEALLDYPIEPRDARSLDAAASAATSPEVLGAYVRQRVGDAITFALADRWGPAPLALLELDRVDEDRLRGDIRSAGAPVPAYGVPDARGLLRSVASAVAAVPAGRHPALVTDLDVRRHVRRIIAAQWPMVPVLDRAQVDGTAEIVGRITFSST